MIRAVALSALAATLLASAASAQSLPGPGDKAIVTLGGGVKLLPDYEGSNDYTAAPLPILGLKLLENPFTGAPISETGFSIRPSFRYIDERSSSDNSALKGMEKIDAAFEVGAAVEWTERNWRVFAEARQGFGGHHGQVFDLGLDAILRPMAALTINVGPRASFASDKYMATYFDVNAAEAIATGYSEYSADGGLRSYGLFARADYMLTDRWLLRAEATYNRLSSEAADSPLVDVAGSANQFTVGIGAAYRFGFGW